MVTTEQSLQTPMTQKQLIQYIKASPINAIFVLTALERFAGEVIEHKDELLFAKDTIINPVTWIRAAKDAQEL